MIVTHTARQIANSKSNNTANLQLIHKFQMNRSQDRNRTAWRRIKSTTKSSCASQWKQHKYWTITKSRATMQITNHTKQSKWYHQLVGTKFCTDNTSDSWRDQMSQSGKHQPTWQTLAGSKSQQRWQQQAKCCSAPEIIQKWKMIKFRNGQIAATSNQCND